MLSVCRFRIRRSKMCEKKKRVTVAFFRNKATIMFQHKRYTLYVIALGFIFLAFSQSAERKTVLFYGVLLGQQPTGTVSLALFYGKYRG